MTEADRLLAEAVGRNTGCLALNDFSEPGQWVGQMEMSTDGESSNTRFDAVDIKI